MSAPETLATPGATAAMRRALLAVRVGALLTVDDVRTELDAGSVQGNVLGGVFRVAVRRGWLTPVGYVTSRDRSARGRAVRQYRREQIGPQGVWTRPTPPAEPDLLDLLAGAA